MPALKCKNRMCLTTLLPPLNTSSIAHNRARWGEQRRFAVGCYDPATQSRCACCRSTCCVITHLRRVLAGHTITVLWNNLKEMFEYLLSYSPVHNVRAGTVYLVTTGNDDRVPAHSFKFTAGAARQKHVGDAPILIQVEKDAGHGAGTPTRSLYADVLAFTFAHMADPRLTWRKTGSIHTHDLIPGAGCASDKNSPPIPEWKTIVV